MKTTMFFDGGCPLCNREVAHYRRLDRRGSIRWVDITSQPEALSEHGIGYAAAMERLHALGEDGRIVSGVPAFVTIWRQLPGYRHLARIVEGLGLVPVLDRLYARFAAWRLKRRCSGGACDLPR
jgi:predicted DCC family thiol-disulfide oxidoreductase YuxK